MLPAVETEAAGMRNSSVLLTIASQGRKAVSSQELPLALESPWSTEAVLLACWREGCEVARRGRWDLERSMSAPLCCVLTLK